MQSEANPANQAEHPNSLGTEMSKGRTDKSLDLGVVQARVDGLRDWLKENGATCFKEQRHLDEGTSERIYWHYGYMIALQDVLRFLTGEKLTERNPSDTPSSSYAA
jgi:hypothetical protein